MKKIVILVIGFLLPSVLVQATVKRILFIGNSYTYVNDLPNTLKSLALSLGDSLYVESSAPGGYSLANHTTNATTISKIQQGNWDYVVIQAQSQEPSFHPSQVQTATYPYAAMLDSMVNANNACAETIFFMTWGRKNGDASNCAAYPPICTYAGMQQRLRESYLEMTMDNDASVSPVGVAWKTCRDSNPGIELYQTDESHPHQNGTYLAACVFYSSLFHKSTVGATYVLANVTATNAAILQQIASNTVLDSLENWQQYGDIPFAYGTYQIGGASVQFTSQCLRNTSVLWQFGDGGTSTLPNPIHTYAPGFYTVKLVAISACGKTDTFSFVLNYMMPTSVGSIGGADITVLENNKQLHINHAQSYDFILLDMYGRILYKETITGNTYTKDCSALPTGTYVYRLQNRHGQVQRGKLSLK